MRDPKLTKLEEQYQNLETTELKAALAREERDLLMHWKFDTRPAQAIRAVLQERES